MPDFLAVLDVQPPVKGVSAGDDDHTFETLREAIEDLADSWKEPVRVLFSDPYRRAGLGVFIVDDGEIDEDFSTFSLKPDQKQEVTLSEDMRTELTLSCDADAFVDAVGEAAR